MAVLLQVIVALDTKTDDIITAVVGFCTHTSNAVDRALVQPAADQVHRLSAAKDAYLERVEGAVCLIRVCTHTVYLLGTASCTTSVCQVT